MSKIPSDKANEIADAVARSLATITGALVVLQREDGKYDIGFAGPYPTIAPLVMLAHACESALHKLIGPNAKTEGVTIELDKPRAPGEN